MYSKIRRVFFVFTVHCIFLKDRATLVYSSLKLWHFETQSHCKFFAFLCFFFICIYIHIYTYPSSDFLAISILHKENLLLMERTPEQILGWGEINLTVHETSSFLKNTCILRNKLSPVVPGICCLVSKYLH